MFKQFLINPLLAVLLSAAIASLLGSLVLWKRLVYFGDAISHSTLLAVAASSFFVIDARLALLIFAIIFAFLVANLQKKKLAQSNVSVMVVAYFCVSLALILKEVLGRTIDFSAYIFGDVFLAGSNDIAVLLVILFIVISFFLVFFKKTLLAIIDEDLAQIAKINFRVLNFVFLCILAVSVAFMAKIVGILLMTALLILPSSIARIFSKSPQQMTCLSLIIGILVAFLSFSCANHFDITIAPVMIFVLCSIFLISSLTKKS